MLNKSRLVIALVCLAVLVAAGTYLFYTKPAQQVAPPPQPVNLAALKVKAEGGDPESEAQLGKLYATGDAVALDYQQAAKWYLQAANQGNAEAQAALGELYETGQGVSLDPVKAADCYRLAANKGNLTAQYDLAVMCEKGRGMPANQVEAAKWYQMAAERGDALAEYNLGQRYDAGIGVAVDHVEAFKWLSLAAAQHQSDAEQARAKVKEKMSSEEIAEAKRRVNSFSSKPEPSVSAK